VHINNKNGNYILGSLSVGASAP